MGLRSRCTEPRSLARIQHYLRPNQSRRLLFKMETTPGWGWPGARPFCCDLPDVALCRLGTYSPRRWEAVDSIALARTGDADLFSRRICSGPVQPRTNHAVFDGPDKVANQVYGPGNRRAVRTAYLPGQSIAALQESRLRIGYNKRIGTYCGQSVVRAVAVSGPIAECGRLRFHAYYPELIHNYLCRNL